MAESITRFCLLSASCSISSSVQQTCFQHIFSSYEVILLMSISLLIDLDDASHTDNPPCSAELTCTDAYTQNLGGCDPAQGSCVCKRGYQLADGLCIGRLANTVC